MKITTCGRDGWRRLLHNGTTLSVTADTTDPTLNLIFIVLFFFCCSHRSEISTQLGFLEMNIVWNEQIILYVKPSALFLSVASSILSS